MQNELYLDEWNNDLADATEQAFGDVQERFRKRGKKGGNTLDPREYDAALQLAGAAVIAAYPEPYKAEHIDLIVNKLIERRAALKERDAERGNVVILVRETVASIKQSFGEKFKVQPDPQDDWNDYHGDPDIIRAKPVQSRR